MKKLATLFFAMPFLALAMTFTASAQDAPFNDAEQAEINAMIRAYILENPEIIPEAIAVLQQRDEARRIDAVGENLYGGPGAVVAGNPEGTATIVEFFDYRCPYCKRGWRTIQRLLDEDKNLRVVFRQFPIKDAPGETISRDAALAALAADKQGKYLEFHDAMFSNPTVLTQDRMMEIAKSVGLDMAKLKKDMADPALSEGLDRNLAIARTLRLTGTPSYILAGTIHSGLTPYDDMKRLIAEQRASHMPSGGN